MEDCSKLTWVCFQKHQRGVDFRKPPQGTNRQHLRVAGSPGKSSTPWFLCGVYVVCEWYVVVFEGFHPRAQGRVEDSTGTSDEFDAFMEKEIDEAETRLGNNIFKVLFSFYYIFCYCFMFYFNFYSLGVFKGCLAALEWCLSLRWMITLGRALVDKISMCKPLFEASTPLKRQWVRMTVLCFIKPPNQKKRLFLRKNAKHRGFLCALPLVLTTSLVDLLGFGKTFAWDTWSVDWACWVILALAGFQDIS